MKKTQLKKYLRSQGFKTFIDLSLEGMTIPQSINSDCAIIAPLELKDKINTITGVWFYQILHKTSLMIRIDTNLLNKLGKKEVRYLINKTLKQYES